MLALETAHTILKSQKCYSLLHSNQQVFCDQLHVIVMDALSTWVVWVWSQLHTLVHVKEINESIFDSDDEENADSEQLNITRSARLASPERHCIVPVI